MDHRQALVFKKTWTAIWIENEIKLGMGHNGLDPRQGSLPRISVDPWHTVGSWVIDLATGCHELLLCRFGPSSLGCGQSCAVWLQTVFRAGGLGPTGNPRLRGGPCVTWYLFRAVIFKESVVGLSRSTQLLNRQRPMASLSTSVR